MRARSDEELAALRTVLRARLDDGESLDSLLPEAFAAVREAARRALGQRHHDEQILGAIALHHGAVVEMKTGEGKTLTATAPAYLHALTGEGVHVLTGDDYLANRDAAWMTPVYRSLGMTCGLLAGDDPHPHQAAYAADVTYGTYIDFCYDYLRDHLARQPGGLAQRGLRMAIVDEADFVMIDDARGLPTISRNRDDGKLDYADLAEQLVGQLRCGEDYDVDQGRRTVALTDAGIARTEGLLGITALYQEGDLLRDLRKALVAKEFLLRDRDYVVLDGRIHLVEEQTGLVSPADITGFELALTAKEGLPAQATETVARMYVRDYLRQYPRLTAITGVAGGDAELYEQGYGLSVVTVPPHRPVVRVDRQVAIYLNGTSRMAAVLREVDARHATGQPMLIGTRSLEHSERISAALTEHGVVHQMLNLKQPAEAARIIAEAGRLGAVTVVTRMAGRGVDIRLGGDDLAEHDQVVAAGGLFVLGAEMFETRRLEQHLRGRSGRHGEPGESAFFIALDDEMWQTAPVDPKHTARMGSLIAKGADPLEIRQFNWVVTRFLNQRSAHMSAQLIEAFTYDAVLDEQRTAIYRRRQAAVNGADLREYCRGLIDQQVDRYVAGAERQHQDVNAARASFAEQFRISVDAGEISGSNYQRLGELLRADAHRRYDDREAELDALNPDDRPGTKARQLEQQSTIVIIDRCWRQHLQTMEDVITASALHRVAGRDQLTAYRRDAAEAFGTLVEQIDEDIVKYLLTVRSRP